MERPLTKEDVMAAIERIKTMTPERRLQLEEKERIESKKLRDELDAKIAKGVQ